MVNLTHSDRRSGSLRLSPLALALLSFAVIAPCSAQQMFPLEVEEVVVSDIRSERSGVSTSASIVVISREEIEESGAAHVVDVLRGRGGVQVSEFFGDGSRVNLGIRGFGESANANVLVLVDGRRLNNNDIGAPDFNSISLNDIERIEIIQGSAGVLFGDQAVGGVINIITRRPEKRRVEIGAEAGSYNRRGVHASVSQRLENGFYYRLSGEKRASDNYRDHNDINVGSVFANTGFEYASGDVFAEFLHVNEKLQTPGALFADEVAENRRQVAPPFANDFINTETTVERVGIKQAISDWLSLEAEATNREAETDFLLSGRAFPGSPSEQSRHLVAFTPRLIAAYPTRNGELLVTLGHDLELFDYKLSSVFGVQENDQKVRGTYVQLVVPVHRKLSLTLGAREASVKNDLRDNFTFPAGISIDDSEFFTELGVSFRPTNQWRLFARRDESVRFPKVDEYLDSAPPGTILKTQTGVSYELGVEWSNGRHDARVVAYRLDLNNEIAAVPGVGFSGFPANTNLDATRRDGLIVGGGAQITDRLRVSADYSFIDARVVEGLLDGNRVPFVAEHILRIAGEYDVTPRWRLYGEVQAISDRVFSGDFDNELGTLPGYSVVNLNTDYRYENWTFEARINNLLDKKYSDYGARASDAGTPVESFYPSPERNFRINVRLDFD